MKILYRLLGLLALAACLLSACEQPEVKEPVKIRLNKELMSNLHVGETQKLEASVTPYGADVTLVWTSDNESVAVVDDEGNVTGVAPGTAEVTVAADETVAKCKVIVLAITPESISLDTDKIEMAVGQTRQLEAILAPKGASADDLQWTSGKESVATVADGVITAVAAGQTVITVSCNGGKLTAECEVTVTPGAADKVYVSSISMVSSLELKVGGTSVLTVVALPENATDKSVTFSCDGDCISIDEATGAIEALKVGTAVITASANDGSGVKAECNVKVTSHGDVTSVAITAEGDATDVQVGKGLQLYAQCLPAGAVPQSVSWTVDNPGLATVDQTGVLTGVGALKGSDGQWNKVGVTVNADGAQGYLSFRVIPRQPDAIEVDLPEGGQLRIGEPWQFNPRIVPEGLPFSIACYGDLNEAYGTFVSATPGLKNIDFYVSDHDDLVYSSLRAYVHIDVIPYWVESVSIPETYSMQNGTSTTLVPSFTSDVEGVQPTYTKVVWSSSDPSVASVDQNTGEIRAVGVGETVITVTTDDQWAVPEGQAQKSASCTLTVTASDNSLNVGDYYYSDGTWSSELQSGKTVIGVVFAKMNATASDPLLARDFPGCTHGLVVSTVEYAEQDFGAVSAYNGHGYYAALGYDANAVVDTDKSNGYGNTLAHKDMNASRPDYCLLFNAESGVVATHTASFAAPAVASSWFIPSFKEMQLLVETMDAVNAKIAAAGGTCIAEPHASEDSTDAARSSDWYWSSTIHGEWYAKGGTYDHAKYAFDIYNNGWTKYVQSSAKCKVRVILAF